MPQEEDDWDLNSPARVRDAMSHQRLSAASGPQAESAVAVGNPPAELPTTPESPDGRLRYA